MGKWVEHQWEYDIDRLGYVCTKPAMRPMISPTDAYYRCSGCGMFVSDADLCRFAGGTRINGILTVSLDHLANTMGATNG
jgi:hypothetical protein